MKLGELERTVQRYIHDGGALPAALAAAVAPPATERWQIYAEGYRLRLAEALGTQLPALAARCGRDAFAARVAAFIAVTPSVHRSIRDYGRELPAHLAAGARYVEDEMRAELAEFEWQLAAAFDAAPGQPAAVTDLAGVAADNWPALRFRAVPSLARLATTTNAVAAWRAAKAAIDAGAASGPLCDPAPERQAPIEWLILRPRLDAEFRSLPADEAAALDRLLAGDTFGALCEQLAATLGDGGAAALAAAGWLKGWLQAGALERV